MLNNSEQYKVDAASIIKKLQERIAELTLMVAVLELRIENSDNSTKEQVTISKD